MGGNGIALTDLSAVAPISYDSNTGEFTFLYNPNHFKLDGSNRLRINIPTKFITARTGVEIPENPLSSANDGLLLDFTTAIVDRDTSYGLPMWVQIVWQLDPAPVVNGANYAIRFAFDIYRSDNGGAFNLVGSDFQKRDTASIVTGKQIGRAHV